MLNKQLFNFRNPVVAVSVIATGNFPLAVLSLVSHPALLCGSAMV